MVAQWNRWRIGLGGVVRRESSVELVEIGLGGVVGRKAFGDSLELGLGTGGILFSGGSSSTENWK